MALKAYLPSTPSRPTTEARRTPKVEGLKRVLNESFDFTTVLLMGAFIQGTLLYIVPRIWVLAPTLILLLSRVVTTLAITLKWAPNPYIKGSIPQRMTAVIPDAEGEFNKEGNGSSEKVAILLLGLRSNHPLGYFAPHMPKINDLNNKMAKALDTGAPDNGFLGQSNWTSRAENGGLDLLLIMYFRTLDDVRRFAVSPTHKETWAWWEAHAPELKHVGISHEVFEADRSMYENVYVNFQPTRLGATSFLRKGDEMVGGTVPDTWISPLVDASKGKLRNSKGRLGRVDNGGIEDLVVDEKHDSYSYSA